MSAFAAAGTFAVPDAARPSFEAMVAIPGSVVLLVIALVAWHARAASRAAPAGDAGAPARSWGAKRQADLEGVVAEFAGPAATAHALRCVALVDMLRDHLALRPEEADHLAMAAALHVLPAAFPASEDSDPSNCEFEHAAIRAAEAKLRRLAPEEAVRMACEVCERWDGAGRPNRLLREEASLGGRILATVCRFDHASGASLEAGLQCIRDGSGSVFDPVVVAEVIHLFREPWQLRVAA